MTEPSYTNEKVVLAVSFLAILATMYGYKDTLCQLKALPSFSLYNLLIYMSSLLFLSIYLSSLANLKYIYKTLEKSILLRKCDRIAEILYLFAIVALPTAFLGGYLVSITGNYFFSTIIPGLNHVLSHFFENSYIHFSKESSSDILDNISMIVTGVIATVIGGIISQFSKKE